MDELDRQLKEALGRREAPPWFEAKVLAAAARQPEPARGWWRRWSGVPRLRWAAAMLAAVTVVTGIAWQRERIAVERAAGEQAKAKLELALRITSAKLQIIEQKIHQSD